MKNVNVSDTTNEKLINLKLQYKKKHGSNITFMDIVGKLVKRAKLKDIEL